MESKIGIQKTPANGSESITVLPQLPSKLIVEALDQFNLLRSYPLTTLEIVQWAVTIERVVPNLDPLALCWLVDEMLVGRYDYDKQAGIQNLTIPLMKIVKTEKGYKFQTDFPG